MPVAQCKRSKQLLARIRQTLPDKKVSHCVFAAEFLSSFAPSLGLDHDEAVEAGLLHDLCRGMAGTELLMEARRLRLPVSEVQMERPVLLHGPVAAEWIRSEFGVSDAVHEAVYWHTTGRPGLGLLGQGLCLADFAEPTRKYPEADEARALLRRDGFPAAVRYMAEMKLVFSARKEVSDPNTEAFCLWLRGGGA